MEILRTIIVDDSPLYRKILERTLDTIESVELVGKASNGVEGLELIEARKPDLVLLDVEMPTMDGLEVLEQTSKRYPEVSVLMVSSASDTRRTVKALGLGAIDFIVKPESGNAGSLRDQLWKCVCVVLARQRSARGRGRLDADAAPAVPATPPPRTARRPEPLPAVTTPKRNRAPGPHPIAQAAVRPRLIVIGVSTGGPRALEAIVPNLPADFPCPLLIVQHMPAGFTESLASSLDSVSLLEVREAKDGDALAPGRVLIAPGGRHLGIESRSHDSVARVHDGPPRNECRPSVDVLLDSVRDQFAGPVLAVILTGMGNDGSAGVAALKEQGAYCVVQDQETCVVYGMPRSVVDAGNADEVLPLDEIAPRLVRWATGIDDGSPS